MTRDRKIFTFFTCLFFISMHVKSEAQNQSASDTVKVTKVMLIPYDPRFYLSDADRDIAEQSKMNPDKFRSSFRDNIDRNVQRAINSSYNCISLLNDTADIYESVMYKILGRTGYRYEKAIPISPKPQDIDDTVIKTITSDPKKHQDSKTASQYIPVEKDAMYMHAVISKPKALFDELNAEFETDYYVFLTQLDIKTNYNSCLDIANKIYRREVKLHFTIYNRDGNLVAGSYATSFFPSDSNSAFKIIGDCFPDLGRYVAGCLP